ncbi:hypothetical protein [Pseudonocardia sp. T1-2H]|uniref:hypothetical protein n=1 Tax=Pseudonocardia sp. T1-2H TaxID=3128899 RepID=UPI003101090A
MISSFWSGLGGKLAERGAAALFTPAFAFWALGVGAWLLSRPDAAAQRRLMDAFEGLSGIAQATLIVLVLLVVAASSVVAERLALAVLRVLEGYWPRPLRALARALVRWRAARFVVLEKRWVELYARHEEGRSAQGEEQELVDLERRLAALPARADRLMPTRLGNVLRAAESGVEDKYGIDPVRCWPALWLVLPDATRTEVTAARASLDTAATWVLWSVLVVVWAVFTPWAVPVAVVAAVAAYANLLGTAARYGELVDAAFALHRGLLYDALGRPRPSQPSDERAAGRVLTAALWRGPEVAAQLPSTAPDAAEAPAIRRAPRPPSDATAGTVRVRRGGRAGPRA